MTKRDQALLLRLAAAELTNESRSIIVLCATLHRLGWTDNGLDEALASLRAALTSVAFRQSAMELDAA